MSEKSQWIFDLVNIIAKRSWVEKKDAVWVVLEQIDLVDELYAGGSTPQEAYSELEE